jgi:hypothetical protein
MLSAKEIMFIQNISIAAFPANLTWDSIRHEGLILNCFETWGSDHADLSPTLRPYS